MIKERIEEFILATDTNRKKNESGMLSLEKRMMKKRKMENYYENNG